ncbi:MAG: MFS transporter [Alphaproteobacteria bacterium]|nr:MFS transporter [Alphaproteobacteria bacterium]
MKKLALLSAINQDIPRTIWAIGVSSLLINLATSVVQSGSAVYLKMVLGIAISTIGLIEAVVECIANLIKIFSGVISDYLRRRKWIMALGFSLLTISKPLLAISKDVSGVLFARTIDRIGNGIQATPRDALISDSAPKATKGACYGLRQSLAIVGSTLGGVFGMIVMELMNDDFQLLFSLATIPAIFATLILVLFVKETSGREHKHTRKKIKLKDLKSLGSRFWLLMVVVSVFMLARFGEFFISLHACTNLNMEKAHIYVITIIFNLFTTLAAYPAGILSDKMSRINLLFIGFAMLFFADISIGFANNLFWIWIGATLWGIQRGMSEGIFAVLVSDHVPQGLKGTGFGMYYTVVAVSTFCASTLAGLISQRSSESMAFVCGAAICVIASTILFAVRKRLRNDV